MTGSHSHQSPQQHDPQQPQYQQSPPRQPLPHGPQQHQQQSPPRQPLHHGPPQQQRQDLPHHIEQHPPAPAPLSALNSSPTPPGPPGPLARKIQPCIHCAGLARLIEFYNDGLIYTMNDKAQVCRCGRTFYLYDCLVIAVDSEITFCKETGYYKTAIGLHFASNSPHNFSKLIDRKNVDDPEDPPSYREVKEQTERNAGVSGILAAVDVVVASKLSVSKIVIKTHSTIFVKGMTQNWQPNAGVDTSSELVAHQAYFLEAQKAIDKAAAHGIEVVFWLVGFDENNQAFALAKAELYARPA